MCLLNILIFLCLFSYGFGELWCYSCTNSEPGCSEFYVDWRMQHAITCIDENDKCVKIVARKGAETFVTRDCLSNLKSQIKNIPADRYDGCRTAAKEPKKAVYVQNEISELEVTNDYYDEVTYCMCEFDQWCNTGAAKLFSLAVISMALCANFLYRGQYHII